MAATDWGGGSAFRARYCSRAARTIAVLVVFRCLATDVSLASRALGNVTDMVLMTLSTGYRENDRNCASRAHCKWLSEVPLIACSFACLFVVCEMFELHKDYCS